MSNQPNKPVPSEKRPSGDSIHWWEGMTPDGISKVARSLLPAVEISENLLEPTAMAAAADCQLLRVITDPTPVVEFSRDPEGEFEAWWHNSGRWMDPDYKGGCSMSYRIAKAAYIEGSRFHTPPSRRDE